MSSRDDMVIRPRTGLGNRSVRERAAEERRVSVAVGSEGGLRGALRSMARAGIGGLGLGAARYLGATGIAAGGAAALAAIIVRTKTGRSFENLGQQIRQELFGDADEEAASFQMTRMGLAANENLMRFVGENGVTDQVRSVFAIHQKIALRKEQGRSKVMQSQYMEVDGLLDLLILRFQEKMVELWTGNPVYGDLFRLVSAAKPRGG